MILYGRPVADKILSHLKGSPGLGVVLTGSDPASHLYVRKKKEACSLAGASCVVNNLSTEEEVLAQIREWNKNPEIDGILVQLPVVSGINAGKVLAAVAPEKDVDGFHPENMGLLLSGRPRFVPCTVAAVLEMILHYELPTVGKKIVVVNNSNVVGTPLAVLLSRPPYNATVAICHQHTGDLEGECRGADIVVSAVGKEGFSLPPCPGVVIDVGTRRVNDKTVGDFRPEPDSKYSPVPGGVGVVTVAALLRNLFKAQGDGHVAERG